MKRALPLLMVATLLAGCLGYTVGPVKPTRMKRVETIAVPTFESSIVKEPKVEVLAADSVIKQIQLDGTYKIGRMATADAILEGEVKSITRLPARSVERNVLATREFTLRVTFHFKVRDRKTGLVLMQGNEDGETSFFVSEDIQQDERQALPLAFQDAATQVVGRITEGF